VFIAWSLLPWPLVKVLLAMGVYFSTIGWYQVLMGEAYACAHGKSGTVMAINSLAGLAGGAAAWFVGWMAGQAGLPAAMWLLLVGPVSLAFFVPGSGGAGEQGRESE
jgi:FSR family fosmidomycin resistance protein-like MFS transporter